MKEKYDTSPVAAGLASAPGISPTGIAPRILMMTRRFPLHVIASRPAPGACVSGRRRNLNPLPCSPLSLLPPTPLIVRGRFLICPSATKCHPLPLTPPFSLLSFLPLCHSIFPSCHSRPLIVIPPFLLFHFLFCHSRPPFIVIPFSFLSFPRTRESTRNSKPIRFRKSPLLTTEGGRGEVSSSRNSP